jgi:hypothetical protein
MVSRTPFYFAKRMILYRGDLQKYTQKDERQEQPLKRGK